jgi:orotate phosphoribosyltransferase
MNQVLAKALSEDLSFFTVGPFLSSSKTVVPLYLEFRKIYSDPKILKILAQDLGRIVKKTGAQVVAGAEMAGLAPALAVSLEIKIPFVYVKKERKKFLAKKFVEGVFQKGSRGILIDDTLIFGSTKKKLIANARKDGLVIKDILVIYQVGGLGHKRSKEQAWFKKRGIKIHRLFFKEELLNYLIKKKLIPQNTLQINQRYGADPAGWIKNKKYWHDFLVWKKECKKYEKL